LYRNKQNINPTCACHIYLIAFRCSYLNALVSCNTEQKTYDLIAIGAHNDEKSVTISYLEGKERKRVASKFNKNIGNIFHMHIQPIEKNDTIIDIIIGLGKDGHMQKGILGNVFWIGQVTATRASVKILPTKP